ncbi:MAG: hypothetical protein ACI9RZ_002586 [Sphingobacteriales bacterium]|jgi:hypothetical protein
MPWAQRLKRVFAIDIETGHQCASVIKIIADPVVITKVLSHLNKKMMKLSKSFFRKVDHFLRQVYLNQHKFIINKSNIHSWFAQQRDALALYLKFCENG